MSTPSTKSAVNDVNHVNDVNNVQTPSRPPQAGLGSRFCDAAPRRRVSGSLGATGSQAIGWLTISTINCATLMQEPISDEPRALSLVTLLAESGLRYGEEDLA
jgi:hypothetical protein